MQLEALPEHRKIHICVGTSLRKPLNVLKPYLANLRWQELPPKAEVSYCFVDDGLTADARKALDEFVGDNGTILRGLYAPMQDFDDTNPQTHQWSQSAMARVGSNKNAIIKYALEIGADYLFFADADLILDTTTLYTLWATEKPIVTGVYWTYWHRDGYETRKIHAAPQVWLKHPYGLDGRGMDESEFRRKLINRELFQVPGYGACTLIARKVLEAGISFSYLPDVPLVGLMAGEDRHFCLRAERAHIPAFADGWPDCFHIYRPEDAAQIPAMQERLGATHPQQATLGDLVSLKLQPLEPVPHQQGWTMVQPQFARGRLGTMALMPEIEEAVFSLKRKEDVTVPVHFDVSHPVGYYHGKRRLIRVTLIDCKPYCFAPVVENELFVGEKSGRWISTTDHTDATLEGMKEVANA